MMKKQLDVTNPTFKANPFPFYAQLQRMPNLRLRSAPDQLRWRGTFLLRGLEALPVSF